MIRYLISLVIFLAGIILATNLAAVSGMALLDIPSFVLVGVLPFLFISTLYGFKEMAQAFSMAFKKSNAQEDLAKALTFFQKFGNTIWLTGILGVIIGIVSMLINLDDKSAIGPSLALALISLFYSALINILLIIPFKLLIKKQMTVQK